VYNERTNVIEKSIRIVFDETDNNLAGTSSFDEVVNMIYEVILCPCLPSF